jgi:NADPH:quinone reductase-like Zn-dependent oxidoreductase
MICTALETHSLSPPASTRQELTFILDPESRIQTRLVDLVCEYLTQKDKQFGHKILPIDHLATLEPTENSMAVFLPELERPLLTDMNEVEFTTLQDFLCKAQNILWVTAARKISLIYPQVQLVRGMSRVLCTENNKMSFVTAFLEDHTAEPKLWAKHISDILSTMIMAPGKLFDLEYQEENSSLSINRVTEADDLNASIFDKSVAIQKMKPFLSDAPLTITVSNPGFLDSGLFVEDEKYWTELKPNEVELRVEAIGINFRDLLVMLGRYSDSDTIGLECAGIVTRVGSNCSSFSPGDRVAALIIGCLQTFARCDYRQAVRIPDHISYSTAAAVLVPGITAYHSLVQVARLKARESILIHSGAGGTGQMAIQIAQTIGAEVYVTVGSDEKKSLLKRLYNIPDDHILYSRDTSFARDLMLKTSNRGVDVVLNSLSGDGLVSSWECIAPFGRFVEIGNVDVESNSKLPMAHFKKNVSFSLVAVDHMCTYDPTLIQAPMELVVSMVGAGTLKHASPLQEFSVAKLEDAFRFMQGGKHTGKLVINFNTTDPVPVSSSPLRFHFFLLIVRLPIRLSCPMCHHILFLLMQHI